MGVVEDLADDLARETLVLMEELNDDRFFYEVAKVVGASSPTLEEAYLTARRVRMASVRGRKFLEATLKAKRAGVAPPAAPPDSATH